MKLYNETKETQQKYTLKKITNTKEIYIYISHSEYLVTNPVQSALPSNKRQKAKFFFEYFWLGMTVRPEGSRNLF